jgi:hypothetical protein
MQLRSTEQQVTDSMESMLPGRDRLQAAGLDLIPESILEQVRATECSVRPVILCIDGRNHDPAAVDAWLRRFRAVVSEQFENCDTGETVPWTPMLAVALPTGKQKLSDEWTECSDIDWIPSEQTGDDVCELYLNEMRKRLASFLGGTPDRTFSPPSPDQLVRYEDLLTDSQKAAWAMTVEDDESWDDT